MMLSSGFASCCAESEHTPLELNRFREAILGLGHTFKNVEKFWNAIYQMSLAERFQYKYKKFTYSYVHKVFSLGFSLEDNNSRCREE